MFKLGNTPPPCGKIHYNSVTYSNCTPHQNSELGRTLLEMLAVLAVMGVLSVAAIKMYGSTGDKVKTQTIAKYIQTMAIDHQIHYNKRAVVQANKQTVKGPYDFELSIEDGVSGNTFNYFWITAKSKEASFCKTLKEYGIIRYDFVTVNGALDGACQGTDEIKFYFRKNPANKTTSMTYTDKEGKVQFCPDNAKCTSTGWNCMGGYQKQGDTCVCPDHGDCSGENLVCDEGYFVAENGCLVCPENASCENGEITCHMGYEQVENECLKPCTMNTQCTVCGACEIPTGEENGYCQNECSIPEPNLDAEIGQECGSNQCIVYDPTTQTCSYQCTRVEYLESTTKNAFINTGIPATNKTKWEIGCSFLTTTTGQIFGYGYAGVHRFNMGIESNRFRFAFSDKWFDSTTPTPDTDYHVWILDANTKTGSIDGGEPATYLGTQILQENGWPIMLLNRSINNSNIQGGTCGMRIYYNKIWNDGRLVSDMIPVIAPNEETCLFDRLSSKLFCLKYKS